jgi:hypothetical protein
LKHKYKGYSTISEDEIKVLREYGHVTVYKEHEEAKARAKALESYILSKI